jgi:DNA repair protein RadD
MSAAPELRPYQREVIAQINTKIGAGKRRILLVAPTGAGKMVIAADIVAKSVARGERVLFLAHRRELIKQTSAKLFAVGVDHGLLLPGYAPRLGEAVQVASITTLLSRALRTASIKLPRADLVIVDEAHHARARTYELLLEAYPEAVVIGMTATPCRKDGRGLGTAFDVLVECPPIAELITAGYLVPSRFYAPTRPDLSGVPVKGGDYAESQLAERMDKPVLVGDIVSHWHKLGERRRTVVFASGVAHSLHLRDEFRRSGVLAEHIDGSTPFEERDKILIRLAAGTVDLVCNAMVLTEGWDQPEVSCLVLARPTKSLGLYRQMVGRVLRPASGKVDAVILDHAGAVFSNGFPEDPIIWNLAEDHRAENAAHNARRMYRAPALTICPECAAVRFEGRPCALCGWRTRPKPIAVHVADGELGQVDRNRTVRGLVYSADEKLGYYQQLLYIANERGYRIGWAAHKYHKKFGDWPPLGWRSAEPLPPEPATLSWVRSQQIAYAKSRAA